jgi:hypothetical protein
VDDMPGSAEPSLGRDVSRNSWGYRLAAFANYSSVFGGINVAPRVVWGRDVRGTTPGPTSTFLEGRRFATFGLSADYLLRFEADLAYTRFSGAGSENLLRDRDYVSLRFTYAF